MIEKSLLPIERHHRRIGAAFKNKRVFLDHRGNTLLLDYRGSTGRTRMDIASLRKLSGVFKGGPLGHGKTQNEGVESYSRGGGAEGFGFLITRAYDFNDIREDEDLTEYLGLEEGEPYVDRDILHAIDKWLSDDGWKVTWK